MEICMTDYRIYYDIFHTHILQDNVKNKAEKDNRRYSNRVTEE